jgi:tetratricopeptide (TPR) repeat protein
MFASSIVLPMGKHVTADEQFQLTNALGEYIGAAWKLFHMTDTAQVLAIGQAQLYMVRQSHDILCPHARRAFYSAVYRLIGAARYFEGRYQEARQACIQAYIAALESNDKWNMSQSLSWQAYTWNALGKPADASRTTDMALQLISQQNNTENAILRSRLLATSAENEALLGNIKDSKNRLSASEKLLESLLKHHEEFDKASWYQYVGLCALHTKQYNLAAHYLQEAMNKTPPHWLLRQANVLIPLATAYVYQRELDTSLEIANKAISVVEVIRSRSISKQFEQYVQHLINNFNSEPKVALFVAHHIPPL